jgi:hypothetical protein
MVTIDLLTTLGFTLTGSCNCNGGYYKKYKRGEWLIYLSATKYKVKKNGITVKSYSPVEGLQEYLSKAVPQFFT